MKILHKVYCILLAKNAGIYIEYIFLRTEHIMVHFEVYLEGGPFKMSLSLGTRTIPQEIL
jgi:hypothetical protein